MLSLKRSFILAKLDFGSMVYSSVIEPYITIFNFFIFTPCWNMALAQRYQNSPVDSLYAETNESLLQNKLIKLDLIQILWLCSDYLLILEQTYQNTCHGIQTVLWIVKRLHPWPSSTSKLLFIVLHLQMPMSFQLLPNLLFHLIVLNS